MSVAARFLDLTRRRPDLAVFGKSIVTYTGAQIVMKGLDLVSFALLVRTLTVPQLGLVGVLMALGFVLTDVAPLGVLRLGTPRFIVDQAPGQPCPLRAGFGFFLVYAPIAALVVVVAATLAQAGTSLPIFEVVCLYAGSFLLRALVFMELETLRMKGRALLQSLAEVVPSFLNLGFLLLFLRPDEGAAAMSGWGQVIAWTPLFLLSVVLGVRRGGPAFRGLADILRYSAPLTLHRAMSDLNLLTGRAVALALFGLAGAGAYTFLSRVGDILRIALMPLQKAWLPTLLSAVRAGDDRRLGQLAIAYMALSTVALVGFLCVSTWLAAEIDAGSEMTGVYASIPWIAVAAWATTYYMVFGFGYLVARRTDRLVRFSTLSLMANVVVSAGAGLIGGVTWLPAGAIASSVLFVVLTHQGAQQYYTIRYRPTWIVAAASIAVGCAAAALIAGIQLA